MTDDSECKSRTADGRFTKGNPGGPGPRKAVKAAADALDERVAAAAGDLFDLARRQADEGNIAALKMLLDRVWPVGRSRSLEIGAPEIQHPRDLLTGTNRVTNAVFAGDATAAEAAATAKVLQAHFPNDRGCRSGGATYRAREKMRGASKVSKIRFRTVFRPFSAVFRGGVPDGNAGFSGLSPFLLAHAPLKNGENGENGLASNPCHFPGVRPI